MSRAHANTSFAHRAASFAITVSLLVEPALAGPETATFISNQLEAADQVHLILQKLQALTESPEQDQAAILSLRNEIHSRIKNAESARKMDAQTIESSRPFVGRLNHLRANLNYWALRALGLTVVPALSWNAFALSKNFSWGGNQLSAFQKFYYGLFSSDLNVFRSSFGSWPGFFADSVLLSATLFSVLYTFRHTLDLSKPTTSSPLSTTGRDATRARLAQLQLESREQQLHQAFWDRLRIFGHTIPRGAEEQWLEKKLSGEIEEIFLLSSGKELLREYRRFKTSVLNTAQLFESENPETARILREFGNQISVPVFRLKAWDTARTRVKLLETLKQCKLAFTQLATELNVETLRPLREITTVPLTTILDLESPGQQLERLLHPADALTRSFLLKLDFAKLGSTWARLLADADQKKLRIEARFTDVVKVPANVHNPLSVHLLGYEFVIFDPKVPHLKTVIKDQVRFGSTQTSASHRVAELGEWKEPLLQSLGRQLKNPTLCEELLSREIPVLLPEPLSAVPLEPIAPVSPAHEMESNRPDHVDTSLLKNR